MIDDDKPMTATECLQRMRRCGRRAALEIALRGSAQLKLTYCIEREFAKEQQDLLVFGTSITMVNEQCVSRVMRNVGRLIRVAEVWNGKQA